MRNASTAALVLVFPASTTNITCPDTEDSSNESASPMTGGASMMTMSNWEVTSPRISWNRPVDRRSAGLGGSGPLGINHRSVNWVGRMWLRAASSSPVNSRVSPTLSDAALNAGFLRSLSISSTDAPRRAKFCATAKAEEDLPSPERVLVTTSVLGSPSSVLNRSDVTTAE